jgi:SAM-dependent methyltransferase
VPGRRAKLVQRVDDAKRHGWLAITWIQRPIIRRSWPARAWSVVPYAAVLQADFPWPPLPGVSASPSWTGRGFTVNGQTTSVLSYEPASSGWTDDLTTFHEETAGSDHPIDRASRALAVSQLDHVRAERPVVLEIGCSSGFLLGLIRQRLPRALVIGSDVVRGPLETLAEMTPDVPLLHFDLTRCPLPDQSVDAIVMLNVLEHIRDDAAALAQAFRVLRPGGIVYIEVPAGPHLYDVYDELLMHRRRYTLSGLRQLLAGAGFEIARASHLGVLIYPAFYLVKRRNQRFLSRDQALKRQVVARNIRSTGTSKLLDLVIRAELMLGRSVSWPFGIRCVVTGRRP